ncbi:MAG: hypothetical protein VX633_08840, partial [Verrucomicrobiota bacterium]|nr:hypothetical protein [Verrucomicrobiota bacterium]
SSLELVNPALSNNQGQNWSSSAISGGSPGAANSVASSNEAPLIRNVRHSPVIPRSNDTVVVTAELEHAAIAGTATLHWRVDGEPNWTSQELTDNGTGDLSSEIPG